MDLLLDPWAILFVAAIAVLMYLKAGPFEAGTPAGFGLLEAIAQIGLGIRIGTRLFSGGKEDVSRAIGHGDEASSENQQRD